MRHPVYHYSYIFMFEYIIEEEFTYIRYFFMHFLMLFNEISIIVYVIQ